MKEIAEIIQKIRHCAYNLCAFHENGMRSSINMNMHGLKRYHRCESKCAYNAYLSLANDLGNYGDTLNAAVDEYSPMATPSGIQAHIDSCIEFLAKETNVLSSLNNEFRILAGVGLSCGEELLENTFCSLVKMRRWKQRFEDNKWMPHDVYVFDAALHAKIKKKEKEHREE